MTRRSPGCTICHAQEDQSEPPRFGVDVSPLCIAYCRIRAQSKGLQRQLLAEEFFNTLYKALHKKSLHFPFSRSLLRLGVTWLLLIPLYGYSF